MKEWYLEHTPPEITSGYENDVIEGYAESNFTDVLQTTFSDEVILYNNDLSESHIIRCVIQGNTADTALKSMERVLLAPIGTFRTGMYVFFESTYWIINGRPGNNKSYEKVSVQLCQYNLRWQTSDGIIHERPINISSASKYSTGETSNNVITLAANNYLVLIGYDDAALELDGMRVFIDREKNKPVRVYKFTRTNDVLYDFKTKGSVLEFIADKKEFNPKVDNQELRICDYHALAILPTSDINKTTDLCCTISGGNKIRIGQNKTWTAKFADEDGNETDSQDFTWNIVSEFDIYYVISNNKIQLCVDDDSLCGESFLLQVILNGSVVTETEIIISESY